MENLLKLCEKATKGDQGAIASVLNGPEISPVEVDLERFKRHFKVACGYAAMAEELQRPLLKSSCEDLMQFVDWSIRAKFKKRVRCHISAHELLTMMKTHVASIIDFLQKRKQPQSETQYFERLQVFIQDALLGDRAAQTFLKLGKNDFQFDELKHLPKGIVSRCIITKPKN